MCIGGGMGAAAVFENLGAWRCDAAQQRVLWNTRVGGALSSTFHERSGGQQGLAVQGCDRPLVVWPLFTSRLGTGLLVLLCLVY